MRNATKKITSLLFILLGLMPLLFVFVFILKQQVIRHRMKERLEEQLLHTVTLPDNEIHWTEEGREILVKGKMFDVKSSEHKDGMTTFYGLYDDEEEALNKIFNKDWKKNSSQQNQLLAKLFQSLRNFYFNSPNDIFVQLQAKNLIVFSSSPKLLTQFKTILTPPPQA